MQVLIVEDDELSRSMFQSAVRKWGYDPIAVDNGKAAWDLLKTGNAPRLLLLDWMMPGMDGLEVSRKIKQCFTKTPHYVLLLTAKSMQEDIVEAFEAGIDDFIPKPINLKELQSRIAVGARILEYQDKLASHNEQKNRFLGIAAHDLRNPLTSIKGFSGLLLDGAIPAEQSEELLNIIHNLSQEMLTLIDDLLDISLIESGKFDLTLKHHDINKLVSHRIKLSEMQACNKHIQIDNQVSGSLELIYDQARISQVIDNLLSNAIKYSAENTTITVTVQKLDEDEMIEVAVQDQGQGMSEDQQQRVFGEFEQVGSKPTGGEHSTGLGLAIVKKIIDAHAGDIGVSSKVGEGSRFYFRLPFLV